MPRWVLVPIDGACSYERVKRKFSELEGSEIIIIETGGRTYEKISITMGI